MLTRSGSFEKKAAKAYVRWTFIVSRSSNIYRIYINFDNLMLWNSSFIPYSFWKCFALFVIFQFYFVLIFRFLFVSSWMFPPAVEIVLHNVDAMLCENPTRKIVKAQFIIDEVLGKIFAISCQIRNSDAVLSLSVVEMVCLFPLGVWLAYSFLYFGEARIQQAIWLSIIINEKRQSVATFWRNTCFLSSRPVSVILSNCKLSHSPSMWISLSSV